MAQHARCCLPSFGATSDGPKRPLSIRTRITPSQSAKLLSAFEHNSLDSLLKTAWGLLLYRYTGSEDVCFGYQHYGFGGGCLGTHSSDPEGLLVCKLTIDESDTINTLLKKFRGRTDPEKVIGMDEGTNANVDDYSLFNTTVMVRVCGDRANGGNSVRPMLPPILPEEVSCLRNRGPWNDLLTFFSSVVLVSMSRYCRKISASSLNGGIPISRRHRWKV